MKIVSADWYPKPGDLGHPDTILERARKGDVSPFPPLEPGIILRFENLDGGNSATKTSISEMLAYELPQHYRP